MFSVYCKRKFEVEPVKVIYPDGRSFVYPDLSVYHMDVPLPYIMSIVGVHLQENEVLCSSLPYPFRCFGIFDSEFAREPESKDLLFAENLLV